MRYSPASAWASKSVVLLFWMGGALTGWAAEGPAFTVTPSTVTAGRTLLIECQSKKSLTEARLRVGETQTRFYKQAHRSWVARVGIPATEPAGPHTAFFFPTADTGTLRTEIPFFVRDGSYPVSRISLKPEKDALFTNGAVERDGERLAAVYTKPGDPKKRWRGPFLWPAVGIVSSEFGSRRAYGNRPPTGSHSGVDLANATGTLVCAAAPGRVVLAEWVESFGNVVILDHGQGIYTYYLHMQSASVKEGQSVKRGQEIGRMGQEGIATGPHVHWSLVVAGVRVDPMEWSDKEIP